jgi:hypothetical protein
VIPRGFIFTVIFLALRVGAPCAPVEELQKDFLALTENTDSGPTPEARRAYDHLMSAGEEGWRVLFRALFDVTENGDVARELHTSQKTAVISGAQIDRFDRIERAEVAERARNESWAILYAAAGERAGLWRDRTDRRQRPTSRIEHIQKFIDALATPTEDDEPARMCIAILRVNLVECPDFPGHSFPWSGTQRQRRNAIRAVLLWWKRYRKDL